MAITELVSVEEYLHSTFEHDAEYLEGRIVARSAPEKPHSKTQGYVCRTLHQVAHPLGYEVWWSSAYTRSPRRHVTVFRTSASPRVSHPRIFSPSRRSSAWRFCLVPGPPDSSGIEEPAIDSRNAPAAMDFRLTAVQGRFYKLAKG